jgi:hypothetical protein
LEAQQLRKGTIVWIDAICISQNDTTEKTKQVALRGRIYAEADNVVIDLGPSSEDSEVAMRIMEIPKQSGEPNLAQREARAVTNLLQRPWLSRVWVLQEVYMANGATVLCSPNTIDFVQIIM